LSTPTWRSVQRILGRAVNSSTLCADINLSLTLLPPAASRYSRNPILATRRVASHGTRQVSTCLSVCLLQWRGGQGASADGWAGGGPWRGGGTGNRPQAEGRHDTWPAAQVSVHPAAAAPRRLQRLQRGAVPRPVPAGTLVRIPPGPVLLCIRRFATLQLLV
jgi:hypothetical protein